MAKRPLEDVIVVSDDVIPARDSQLSKVLVRIAAPRKIQLPGCAAPKTLKTYPVVLADIVRKDSNLVFTVQPCIIFAIPQGQSSSLFIVSKELNLCYAIADNTVTHHVYPAINQFYSIFACRFLPANDVWDLDNQIRSLADKGFAVTGTFFFLGGVYTCMYIICKLKGFRALPPTLWMRSFLRGPPVLAPKISNSMR